MFNDVKEIIHVSNCRRTAKKYYFYYDPSSDLFISFSPLNYYLKDFTESKLNGMCDQLCIRRSTLYSIIKGVYLPSSLLYYQLQLFLDEKNLMMFDTNPTRLLDRIQYYEQKL